ncbi:MAG: hypothetical protein U0271_31335 [Polyangiaceae bacterium]
MRRRSTHTSANRKILLLGVGSAVVLAAGLYVSSYFVRVARETEAAEAYASLRACLYGAPLEPGERPSDRLRGLELGGELKSTGDFPQCKESLRKALNVWDRLGVKEDDPRYGRVRKLTRIASEWTGIGAIWLVGNETPFIEELEDELAKAKLRDVPPVKGTSRRVARPRFALPELVSLGKIKAYMTRKSPYRERSMRVAWAGGHEAPSLACWFPQGGAPVAVCSAPTLSNIAVPYPSSDDLEDVVLWDFHSNDANAAWKYRLVRARDEGTLFGTNSFLPEAGWARTDGAVFYSDLEHHVMKVAPGGAPEKLPMGPATGAFQLHVRPGFVVFKDAKDELQFSPIGDAGIGPSTRLGTSVDVRTLRSCATPNGPVLVLLDWQDSSVSVLYPDAPSRYAAPLRASPQFPDGAPEFACAPDGTPRWAWLQDKAVHDLSCPRSGCVERVSGELSLLAPTFGNISVAPVGAEGVVLAYEGHNDGPLMLLNAVRVRRGPVSEIAAATDEVLLATGASDGVELWDGLYTFASGDTSWVGVAVGHGAAGDALHVFRAVGDAPFEAVVRAPPR